MAENRVKVLAGNVLKVANNTSNTLTAELGVDFDKQEVVSELSALADLLRDSGVWNIEEIGLGHLAYRNLCEEFRKNALKESLLILANTVKNKDEGSSDSQLISNIGRLDGSPLVVAIRFVEVSRKLLKASEKRANMLEAQFNGVDPQAEAQRIQELFQILKDQIGSLGTEGDTTCS